MTDQKAARLEADVKAASAKLQEFPRSKNGLVPDDIRFGPAYRAAKAEYDRAFAALRSYNGERNRRGASKGDDPMPIRKDMSDAEVERVLDGLVAGTLESCAAAAIKAIDAAKDKNMDAEAALRELAASFRATAANQGRKRK